MRRALLPVCLLLAAPPAAPEEVGPPTVGSRLPDFRLFDVEGRQLRLGEVKQPVIVLNFWAFWCDTWIAELPQLRELAAQQGELGFKLLSVSVDGVWTDQVKAVCGDEGLPFPVLIDRGSRLSKRVGLRRVPTLLVVGRERRITFVHEGYPGNPHVLRAIRAAASTQSAGP
ncbi:MAG: peroxiredoxin family protein [Armatimonadota bacterium]